MKCGIINYWFCDVHGAILTAYALQKLLCEFRIQSQLVSVQSMDDYTEGISRVFIDKYMIRDTSTYISRKELKNLANTYDCFLVGSDQVFRTEWVSDHWFLDFVPRNVNKVAVSASFGTDTLNCSNLQKKRISYWLNRFNSISIRELAGVDLCKQITGRTDIRHILDPVFLVDKKYYLSLIEDSTIAEKEPFVVSYFRDDNPRISDAIQKYYDDKGIEIVKISDDISIVDFLYLIANCEKVITDSFHGMCFSIIFERQFICLRNVHRGTSRFDSVELAFGLDKGIFADTESSMIDKIYGESTVIDYSGIKSTVEEKKNKDREWIYESVVNIRPLNQRNVFAVYLKALPSLMERPFDKKLKWLRGFIKKYCRI